MAKKEKIAKKRKKYIVQVLDADTKEIIYDHTYKADANEYISVAVVSALDEAYEEFH